MNRSFVHARPPTIARLVILALIVIAVTLAGCDEKKEPLPTVHVIVATRTPKPTFTLVPTSTTAPTLAPTATATELPEPSEATATAFATTFATPAAPAGPTAIAVPTAGPDSTASPDTSLNPLTGQAVSDPAMMNRRVLAVRVGNDRCAWHACVDPAPAVIRVAAGARALQSAVSGRPMPWPGTGARFHTVAPDRSPHPSPIDISPSVGHALSRAPRR